MVSLAHLIPAFPFLAFCINIFFGRKLDKSSALVSIFASTISLFLAVYTLLCFLKGYGSYTLCKWLIFGAASLNIGVIVDPLTCMMLLVVTVIGTLIQIYSIGYMKGDKRFSRFFAYMSLFMSSMLGLLLADNFIVLLIFWEGVGLCSYLLISFWFERPAAARAGMKAFITTRIGDTGLLVGIFVLFFSAHTVYFRDLANISGTGPLFTVAALLIFCGAIGKSAQFPLHVWLPDA
ncbi:MAG: proton-conducting transporter membrane subunit, partial [Candidatus Omnitrophota bacterium]|nr:proton-conducting transporter membrane subunit [Candidatus Omnitrophota bacterium]